MKKETIILFILGIFLLIPNLVNAHLVPTSYEPHKPVINASYNNQIISDTEFRAKNTMTEAQIQQFLVEKGSALANYRVPIDGSVPITIGWNYTVNPVETYDTNKTRGWTAAKIIYNSAQWYDINPQALLATLQKESSLVTSGTLRYLNAAMGYACPETNACDPFYVGFARQMDGAAYQFYYNYKYSELNDARVGVYRKGNTASIDGKSTYIGNSSTAALYRYTPHRPDSAQAYDSWGKLVTAHYYGNYNFIEKYKAWFFPYDYRFSSAINPPKYLTAGSEALVEVRLLNSGTATWYADSPTQSYPTRLNVISGNELMGSSGWLNKYRIKMATATVAPGEIGVFAFKIKATEGIGNKKIKFVPIVENITGVTQPVLRDTGMEFNTYNPQGPLYRFWSDSKQAHFYTLSTSERDSVIRNFGSVWKYEGPKYSVTNQDLGGMVPVYRFWSDIKQKHFYTASWTERESVIKNYSKIWKLEGVAFYVYGSKSSTNIPVYRFWSDSKQSHFYTANENEKNYVIATYPKVWKYEGVAWYAIP